MAGPGPAVLALGGHALLPDPFRPQDQDAHARDLAATVGRLLDRGRGLVLVHGNGPQVGMILLRVDGMRGRLPAETLDVMVAETQGSIGTLLARELGNALRRAGKPVPVTAILTQVVVDGDDLAFAEPSKPVGPAYRRYDADVLRGERGWALIEDPSGGWRRVVASPRPLRVVELGAIAAAVREGQLVVAGGGGGVPVREREPGVLEGVEAVIDKDRTASLLAVSLDAESFTILTAVPHVARDFGTLSEARIAELAVGDARAMLAEGVFPAGSMRPKIDAACAFVEGTGRAALITDDASFADALAGREGTRIVPGR